MPSDYRLGFDAAQPGNPNSVGPNGILDTRASGNAARVLQLTLRLSG